MLHYQTVESATLGLLKKFMAIPEFAHLRLVGGTSMALQVGHRRSVDLDLFGVLELEPDEVNELVRSCGNTVILRNSRNIQMYLVDNIKVDIVNYSYPWLTAMRDEDGLRLASLKDIAAMKMAAVTGRGTRKDFIDVHFLLNYFTLAEMLAWYMEKYADGSSFLVIKSLSYFDDAELDPDPYMFTPLDWDFLKTELRKQVSLLT